MFNSSRLTKISALTMLGLALTSCAMFSGRETPGEYLDDSTITANVKSDILATPGLKVLQINVETMQGVVQLSGFVDSPQSEKKAVNLARHQRGVTGVKDNLIVR